MTGLHVEAFYLKCADAESDTELRRDLFESDHLLRIRWLVDAMNGRYVELSDVGVHRFVGRKHKFFDQPVRDVARSARHTNHFAIGIEFDLGFGQVEVDGAAALAFS